MIGNNGARLVELCPEDKARVAKLIQAAMQGENFRQQAESAQEKVHDLQTRLSKLREQNEEIIHETASLRSKFTHSLHLLNKFQEKFAALEKEHVTLVKEKEEALADSRFFKDKFDAAKEQLALQERELEGAKEDSWRKVQLEEKLAVIERRHRELTLMQEDERKHLIAELEVAKHKAAVEVQRRERVEERVGSLHGTIENLQQRLAAQEQSAEKVAGSLAKKRGCVTHKNTA